MYCFNKFDCGYRPRNRRTGIRSSQDCVPFPHSLYICFWKSPNLSIFWLGTLLELFFGFWVISRTFRALFQKWTLNFKKWLFTYYIFSESWDQVLFTPTKMFPIRGRKRSPEVNVKPRHFIFFLKSSKGKDEGFRMS